MGAWSQVDLFTTAILLAEYLARVLIEFYFEVREDGMTGLGL